MLTGAGCSVNSGIPDYRDADGAWKRSPPVTLQAFMGEAATRRRYWARGLIGWRRVGRARPNAAHRALARLEAMGKSEILLTQNVDRLHQAAGSAGGDRPAWPDRPCPLHGLRPRLAARRTQEALERLNPDWLALEAAPPRMATPISTASIFRPSPSPPAPYCGGVLKPDVVFFGENVPRDRVEAAMRHVETCDAMLVVGSSLMVYSGFRFVDAAARAGKPIAAVNLGRTRADDLLALKVEAPCEDALAFLL